MWDGLEGCRLKFLAAAGHMHRFEDAVEGFFEPKRDLAIFNGEANPQRTKYVIRFEQVRRWPVREWGITIGDAIHCYRSTLDQLVWTFAKDPSHQTSFPICLTEKEWVTKAPAQYWSCADSFVRLLDKSQPYHRDDPAQHPLAILRALSNLDKHRGIPTITLVTDHTEFRVGTTRGIREWRSFKGNIGTPYKTGAVVAEASIVPDDSGLEPHMDVHLDGTVDVAFDQIAAIPGIRNRRVIEVVEEVAEYVGKVLGVVRQAWDEAVTEAEAVDPEGLDGCDQLTPGPSSIGLPPARG